jgi:methyltransferase (TIGR00027 family)
MDRLKSILYKEQETLLITLYCRAKETEQPNPLIVDEKALQMVNQIDYDFSQLKVPTGTYLTTCMRARQFDNYVLDFIDKHDSCNVISLGCGLDSRFYRVDNGRVNWYDLDLPDVIELKKKFLSENKRYRFIAKPVTDNTWFKVVVKKNLPTMLIAEGLFMYLREEQVKALVLALQAQFPGCMLIFDCFSTFTARRVGKHPSLKKTKASIHWGLDDAHEIETWHKGIKFREEWFFTQSEQIKNMKFGYRLLFKISGLFAITRKAHRMLFYEL